MARNSYQNFVELNVSTCGADPRNCGGVNRCRQTARRRATSLGGWRSPFHRREDRPATVTRATPACETFNSSIRAARPMETQSEASAGAAQADRRQLVPPAPGATAFKRGRPVALLHQTGQGKNTVAKIHAGSATPPRRSSSVGESATPVTERSWECRWLTPGRSLLLRLFVSSIYCVYQKTYGSCTCVRLGVFCRSPFDGRPQGGWGPPRTPSQGFERRVPRIHLSVGPRHLF